MSENVNEINGGTQTIFLMVGTKERSNIRYLVGRFFFNIKTEKVTKILKGTELFLFNLL